MHDPIPFVAARPARPARRGRPRKHPDAYGYAANARISVRNCINWTYARQAADALGFAVLNTGPRPIAAGPPELRAITGTTVLTEIGRSLEAIGRERAVALALRVARIAESDGLDANETAKLVRRLRRTPDDADVDIDAPADPKDPVPQTAAAALNRLAG